MQLKSQYNTTNWLREFYIFEEGIVTFWGMDDQEMADVTERILTFATDKLDESVSNGEIETMPFIEE